MKHAEMTKLKAKVELGVACHKTPDIKSCAICPYHDTHNCGLNVMNDALTIADYWKGKYESALLATPPMILHTNPEPFIVKIDSTDIKKTLKYSEALQKVADAGKEASEALNAVTKAAQEIKDVVRELNTAKWIKGPYDTTYGMTSFLCSHCRNIVYVRRGSEIPVECPRCKAVMTGVE